MSNHEELSQEELTRQYEILPPGESKVAKGGRNIVFPLGQTVLDHLLALSIIDKSRLGAQIRRAIDEYTIRRREDPTMPAQIAAAQHRFDEYHATGQVVFRHDNSAETPWKEQLPETD